MIVIKRVYEDKSKGDGYRVLVDRLWPRGLNKEKAGADLWMKDIGPSNELRKWFGHDPAKWNDFKSKYQRELNGKKDLLDELKRLEAEHKKITLLYGAHDEEHNQAVVIAGELKK
jgi:uncharacterized protein YeaO (DUF488 family)